MDLLKRRGATPLRISIENEINKVTEKKIPTVHISEPTTDTHDDITQNNISPLESVFKKLRNFSNLSNSSFKSPDVSPIVPNNTPASGKRESAFSKYVSNIKWQSPSCLEILEKRITSLSNISALDFSTSDSDNSREKNILEKR